MKKQQAANTAKFLADTKPKISYKASFMLYDLTEDIKALKEQQKQTGKPEKQKTPENKKLEVKEINLETSKIYDDDLNTDNKQEMDQKFIWKTITKQIFAAHTKMAKAENEKVQFYRKVSGLCTRESKKVYSRIGKLNPFNKNKRFKREIENQFLILTGNKNLNKVQKNEQEKIKTQQKLEELIKTSEMYSSYIIEKQNVDDKTVFKSDDVKINAILANHQKTGVDWLIKLYTHKLNGILADDMGLGKTIQSLAVLSWISENRKKQGPFLVIAPSSTIPNWKNEIEKFLPWFDITYMVGTGRPAKFKQLKKNLKSSKNPQIVVTPFNTAITDIGMLMKVLWCYIIVDEAQFIKSSESKRWNTLMNLKIDNKLMDNTNETSEEIDRLKKHIEKISKAASFDTNEEKTPKKKQSVGGKLLLTGTPIQNNLSELWALLHFVMPDLFSDKEKFNEWFAKTEDNKKKLKLTEKLQNKTTTPKFQLFSNSMVERLKEILKPFMMRREKKDILESLPKKTKKIIELELKGEQKRIYNEILYSLYDFKNVAEEVDEFNNIEINNDVQRKNLQVHLRKICNHTFLLEGPEINTPFLISDERQIYVGGKKLSCSFDYYSHFLVKGEKFDLNPEYLTETAKTQQKALLEAVSTPKSYYNHRENNSDVLFRINTENVMCFPTYTVENNITESNLNDKGLFNSAFSSFSLNNNSVTDIVTKSIKMAFLAEFLPSLLFGGHKCLVYFQMTKMMNLFEYFCNNFSLCIPDSIKSKINEKFPGKKIPSKLNVCRLDGSSLTANRKVLVDTFTEDDSMFLFLLSTRAAGIGINLVAADTVIFYDRDWNPTVDLQAEDRVHRIGQKRPVTIYYLRVKDSIEEEVEATGERKAEMMEKILETEKV